VDRDAAAVADVVKVSRNYSGISVTCRSYSDWVGLPHLSSFLCFIETTSPKHETTNNYNRLVNDNNNNNNNNNNKQTNKQTTPQNNNTVKQGRPAVICKVESGYLKHCFRLFLKQKLFTHVALTLFSSRERLWLQYTDWTYRLNFQRKHNCQQTRGIHLFLFICTNVK